MLVLYNFTIVHIQFFHFRNFKRYSSCNFSKNFCFGCTNDLRTLFQCWFHLTLTFCPYLIIIFRHSLITLSKTQLNAKERICLFVVHLSLFQMFYNFSLKFNSMFCDCYQVMLELKDPNCVLLNLNKRFTVNIVISFNNSVDYVLLLKYNSLDV